MTLRDLRWRLRRFVIAGTGAAMVFALALVIAGLTSSFTKEAGRVVDGIGADAWVVNVGIDGIFSTPSLLPPGTVEKVAKLPGVTRADPLVVLHHTVRLPGGGDPADVNLVGYRPGGVGEPALVAGRLPTIPGEVVADESLDAPLGSKVQLAGKTLQVVGRTSGLSINGGQPMLHLRIVDAQDLLTRGLPVVTAVVTKGVPTTVPAGLQVKPRSAVREDLLRPTQGPLTSLRVTLVLLWCVAGLVIGSVVYLSALERARDFAVYKATGWSTRDLGLGLALQSVLLALAASVMGLVLAQLMLPLFPLNFTVPTSARLMLPALGLVIGLLASLVGLRRAVGVDPALAFGGAA